MSMYKRKADIIIKNGTIVDGTGSMPYYADIAIVGDKIDFIGNLQDVEAPLVIDAYHKYVTPGFIDCHTHSDSNIWACPEEQSSLRQGVTTEIIGNCGLFGGAYHKDYFDKAGDSVECVYDYYGQVDEYPEGCIAKVLDKAEAMGTSGNVAWLCGHNGIRIMAGITGTEYTEEQFAKMEKFLREAMEAGYIGFSTGLEFDPGIMCKPEEVERLAKIVAEYDGNYSTHMRDEGTYLLESINEFLNVIRKTGIRGTISHLNVKYDNGIPNEYLYKGMQMLKDAREIERLNVYCDMLPTLSSTGGAQAMLPPWLYKDGWDKAKEILADPKGREKVKNDMTRYWRYLAYGQWDRLLYIMPPYDKKIANTPFSELVKQSGKEPVDCFLDILMQAPTIEDVRGTSMQGVQFKEDIMIDTVVKDPIYLWMTDSHCSYEEGPLASTDRLDYMGMIYYFAHYVRDLGAISIEKAVEKATSLSAKHFNLKKRGMLLEGYYADINVFDINELKINSTITDPTHYSEGMHYVLVNGVPTIANGEHTGVRAGRVLRNKPAD